MSAQRHRTGPFGDQSQSDLPGIAVTRRVVYMRLKDSLRLAPLKLHTKTTILVCAVLVAIFSVIAYFSDLAITHLTDLDERQEAQLLATRVADTVEHLIKREQRIHTDRGSEAEMTVIPNWADVQEAIADTIVQTHSQLSEVRVIEKSDTGDWREAMRLPVDAAPASPQVEREASQQGDGPRIISAREQGPARLITAAAPVIYSTNGVRPMQVATAIVVLTFNENQSYAVMLRRLVWPLLLLAIVAITLIVYFLFRYLVYKPIDSLLLSMSKAESGNLTAEAEPLAADEIGIATLQYNRMLGRIRQMNEQLASEHRLLEDRVREATAEIVERKQQLEDANLQLFDLQRQLSRLERLAVAGQMAAEFAHEVGTPLNLISGHVQLLRARVTDPRTITRLDVIAEQINRITNIVRRMLDSTRRPKPQLEVVDINSLLARVLDASQPTLSVRNVRLETGLIRELPHIEADPDQLQQVFLNLINNSLDAMPEGGLLRASTGLDQDSIIIELSDTGMGIPQDQLELVFDPLFTAKPGSGTGLGLTIVKQIITEHAGQIKVQSEPGRGTTFTIRLPLSRAEGTVAASITEGTPLEKKV